jgi:hypothetical protein
MGNTEAVTNLGICYAKGVGCDKNMHLAINCFEEASQKGDLIAKYYLGYHYLYNATLTDKEEGYVKAANLFREVIAKNPTYSKAYYYLGFMFENGFGVEKDFKTSLIYY